MLILFDIDATLLKTSGVGVRAMEDAGRDLLGAAFSRSDVDYAGRLDPLILAELLQRSGHAPTPDLIAGFRAAYTRRLETLLADRSLARLCPGVAPLLDALEADTRITLGLLTGNFPETGAMKIRAAGLDHARFRVAAWGDDSPHTPPSRNHLPPVAMQRHAALHGRPIDSRSVAIIGDTPHDVACAKANNCRVLGVGTGAFSPEHLRSCGADHAVDDLSATADIVRWLTHPID